MHILYVRSTVRIHQYNNIKHANGFSIKLRIFFFSVVSIIIIIRTSARVHKFDSMYIRVILATLNDEKVTAISNEEQGGKERVTENWL